MVGQGQRGSWGHLGPEVLVSDNKDGGELRCEPSVAAFGNTIVASWNDSYGGHHGAPGGTAVAWTISTDRGRTFTFGGYLPRKTESALPSGGDSTVLADRQGDFLLLMLNYQEHSQDLLLYEMERHHPGEWTLRGRFPNTKAEVDRPSMSIDEQGRLWITYTTLDNKGQQQIALIHSNDLGRSWDGPTIASNGPGAKVPSYAAARGEFAAVDWIESSLMSSRPGRPAERSGPKQPEIWGVVSENGGKSFSQPAQLARAVGKPLTGLPGYVMGFAPDAGAYYVANLEIDASNRPSDIDVVTDLQTESGYQVRQGELPSGRLEEVFPGFIASFFPAIAETRHGLAVLAYCRASASAITEVCLSLPVKAGKRRVLTLTSAPTDWSKVQGDKEYAPVQRNFGDYISLAATEKYLVAAWTDGLSGVPRIVTRVVDLSDDAGLPSDHRAIGTSGMASGRGAGGADLTARSAAIQ